MNRKIILLGDGGHAAVLREALGPGQHAVAGFTAPRSSQQAESGKHHYLGDDTTILQYARDEIWLINGIGSTSRHGLRRDLFTELRQHGYDFLDVIHPSAIISESLRSGQGLQALAGCIINTGCCLGDNVLVNTSAVIEHHCRLGDHVHVAPGAIVCGEARIGDSVHIGAGAVVLQGIEIGDHSIVAAGAIVTRPVPAGVMVAGNPAVIKKALD